MPQPLLTVPVVSSPDSRESADSFQSVGPILWFREQLRDIQQEDCAVLRKVLRRGKDMGWSPTKPMSCSFFSRIRYWFFS